MLSSFMRRHTKSFGSISRNSGSVAAPAVGTSVNSLAGSRNMKAEVYYKNQIPFIHLPIPPNFQTQNFIVYPEMTFQNLINSILTQQQGVPVELTDAESGK